MRQIIFIGILCLVLIYNINAEKVEDSSTEPSSEQSGRLQISADIWNVSAIFRLADIFNILNKRVVDPNLEVDVNWFLQKYGHNLSAIVSGPCYTSLESLVKNNRTIRPDELQYSPLHRMLDAWGKIPPRRLLGNMMWLGAYDECEKIDEANYCNTNIYVAGFRLPVRYGTCVPKQCTADDINTFLAFMGISYNISQKLVAPHDSVCDEIEITYSTGAILTILLLAVIVLLVLVGTGVELHMKNKKQREKKLPTPMENLGKDNIVEKDTEIELKNGDSVHVDVAVPRKYTLPVQCGTQMEQVEESKSPKTDQNQKEPQKPSKWTEAILSFSVIRNTNSILSTKMSSRAITSLNGIRFISMTWIIVGHYSDTISTSLPTNLLIAQSIIHRFTYMIVVNSFVAVDTFFLLSGLLLTYTTFKKIESNGLKGAQVLMMYVHRYIRLTPSLAVAMLIWTNIFPRIVSGPLRMFFGHRLYMFWKPCEKYWWSTLLYVNNFYPDEYDSQCMFWTWYLANDTQFYMIAPGILLLMVLVQKYSSGPTKAIVNNCLLLGAMTFLSMLIAGAIIGGWNIPGLMGAKFLPGNSRAKQNHMIMERVYIKPYVRIVPYLVGIFTGYILYKGVKPGRKLNICLWITSAIVAMTVVYGPWKVFKENGTFFNDGENIMYGATHRFIWSCAIAWVVYACHSKCGSFINNFLSWKFFIPLSNLTYSIYLVHLMVMAYFMVNQHVATHYQDSVFVPNVVSTTVISAACAYVLTVTVEYPIRNLERIIFNR